MTMRPRFAALVLTSIVVLTAAAIGAQQAQPAQLPAPPDVAAAPPDAIVTASGLASKVLTPGSGTEHPTLASTVRVHYSGWTPDGLMFDSSVVRGEPSAFGVTRVIRGWTEGVQLMVKGEKRRFWIPSALAYGENPRPGAPRGMLVFDVELLEFTTPANAEAHLTAYGTHKAMTTASPYRLIPWQSIGPSNHTGRMTSVAVADVKGQRTIYVGAASGGVWKSSNRGLTWRPIFEREATASIGDVAVAPSNPAIVWVGTGESNLFRASLPGTGIYKSIDAGRTWQHMGLTDSGTIGRVLVHPTNPNIVYVAASGHEWTPNDMRGVFKTTDGGKTWTKSFYRSPNTGAIDLVMDPKDPGTLYAAMWQRVRRKWSDPRVEPNYQEGGIWKTTDAGATWAPANTGLPEPRFRGRIGIDIARSNPNVLHAVIDNYEAGRPAKPGENDAYGRPLPPNSTIVKGVEVYRSDDKGATWRNTSDGNTHNWDRKWVDPVNPRIVYTAHGQGFTMTENGGRTTREATGIRGTQFYNVELDRATPFRAYGSVQDAGSLRVAIDPRAGRAVLAPMRWQSAPGGEGSMHAIDPVHPNIVYSHGFYGHFTRTDVTPVPAGRGGRGGRGSAPPAPAATHIRPKIGDGEPPLRAQWMAPIVISPFDPRTIYAGYQYIYRSRDRGDTWERISDDLTDNNPRQMGVNPWAIPYQTTTQIAESPLTRGVIYAGTDDGNLHVTRDDGRTWTSLGKNLPMALKKWVSRIVPSKYDAGTVFVALRGREDDDFAPYLFKSTDYGATWTSLVGNIPSGSINVIREDPVVKDVLYAGNDVGVYVSKDGGRSWNVLGANLPSVQVSDLQVHPRDHLIVISTYGRGMWVMDARKVRAEASKATQRPTPTV